MVILALDTTTASGTIALMRGDETVTAEPGDSARTHGERLPGDLVQFLASQALTLSDVDAYSVCAGPGSFTGLRVGLATIQALALVNKKPVVPVPTLEALAWAAVWGPDPDRTPDLVGAWMNAHRGEVFAALYRTPVPTHGGSRGARWQQLGVVAAPTVGRPEVIAHQWRNWREHCSAAPAGITVIGDAVATSRPTLATALGAGAHLETLIPSLSAVAARIARDVIEERGGVNPHAVLPVYVRRPDAELARERKRINDGPTGP